jgi:hypothetical protein
MGIALGLSVCSRPMRIIVVGFRENVFHHLDCVQFYSTWDAALSALKQEPCGPFFAGNHGLTLSDFPDLGRGSKQADPGARSPGMSEPGFVPYHPLTATEHKVRWPKATARVWDFTDLVGECPPERDRPGLHPDNVFDFHDGLRLIVSTDKQVYGTYLHVSASACERSSTIYRKIAAGKMSMEDFFALVRERVLFLSGVEVTLGFLTAGKGVPHFFHPPIPEGIA